MHAQCENLIRFAVKNFCISCLALIFNLSSPRRTTLHAKSWFKVARCDNLYTIFFLEIKTNSWLNC